MNKIIYIGSLYPTLLKENLIKLHSSIDFPADTLQNAIISGIEENGCDLKVISTVNISPYPKVKQIYFPKESFSHNNLEQKLDSYVGCINIPIIQRISKFFRVYKSIHLSTNTLNKKDIIIYGATSLFLLPFYLNKARIHKSCLIVPDLPEYMSGNKNIFYRIAKFIDRRIINFCIKKIDYFVLLSPYMKERLPIGTKPYTIMEGIYKKVAIPSTIKSPNKVILYVGNIDKRYGIIELIESFSKITDDTYQLWIRGDGNTLDFIKAKTVIDKRIVYLEKMSREKILEIQQKATILINPVNPYNKFTRYFFPSKTMEYLASGTPTLMYHLNCIPSEYDRYIYYIDDYKNITEAIIKICQKPQGELNNFGRSAQTFIETQKNPQIQARKILDLMQINLH